MMIVDGTRTTARVMFALRHDREAIGSGQV
jgi:hypothetical protein